MMLGRLRLVANVLIHRYSGIASKSHNIRLRSVANVLIHGYSGIASKSRKTRLMLVASVLNNRYSDFASKSYILAYEQDCQNPSRCRRQS